MLISTIRDEIITEIGGDTADTVLATKILQFINSALRRFPLWTRSRFMYTTHSGTLSSGSSSISLPSNTLTERVVYYISSGNQLRIERSASHEWFNDARNTGATGAPNYYEIIGQTMYFDRTADADYTIYLECQQEQDGVLAGDTLAADTTVAEIIKDGAKSYYYYYVEDIPSAKEFLTLFKNGMDELDAKYVAMELGTHVDDE